jgi:hypothetical protein
VLLLHDETNCATDVRARTVNGRERTHQRSMYIRHPDEGAANAILYQLCNLYQIPHHDRYPPHRTFMIHFRAVKMAPKKAFRAFFLQHVYL